MKLELRAGEGRLAPKEVRLSGFGSQRVDVGREVAPSQPLTLRIAHAAE